MIGIVRIHGDARDGSTQRTDLLAHVRRNIGLCVNVLHAVKTVKLSIPSTHKHVVACFWLNIDCKFHRFGSRSRWSIVQTHPFRCGVEVQTITRHPNAVPSIETRNGHGRVRIIDQQSARNIIHGIRCVEIHRITNSIHVIDIYLCKRRVKPHRIEHPLIPFGDVQ